MDLERLVSERRWNIGDRVYLNTPEGKGGTIIAYMVYESHIEYMFRTNENVMQLEEVSLSDNKVIEY